MLGLGAARLEADMNRLMALLFHQFIWKEKMEKLAHPSTRWLMWDSAQGVLDEQFMQLQQLQDESSPNFVSEVISIYFRESEKLLKNVRSLLSALHLIRTFVANWRVMFLSHRADRECTDYRKIGIHLNQLMGSSSSVGAKRVRTVCLAFRAASEHRSWSGCLRSLEVLEHEYCYLKTKLHELFQMEQQRVMAAGARHHPLLS
ncbi:pseudohistidine-containing phosphotransfer protein 6 [Cocos nucifera]|uniref:Histidine-containing phosphotransfer protein n=1 Tax=Cocos nucifera TaxID=13894 RepID=A0A8K0I9P7_COCNU|nr:pseudohistidine-containing phosphotransfer protein 6 [Cocos nucifera]